MSGANAAAATTTTAAAATAAAESCIKKPRRLRSTCRGRRLVDLPGKAVTVNLVLTLSLVPPADGVKKLSRDSSGSGSRFGL